jgi:regulator of protease activity HflC (stomatin/prohibitin superfamily)
MDKRNLTMWNLAKVCVFIIIGLLLFFNAFTIIQPTQRGVRITLGKADDVVLASGMHLKLPFAQRIQKVSLAPNDANPSVKEIGNAAITKDNQSIMFDGRVYWVVDENRIIDVIKNYTGNRLKLMVEDNVKTAIKSTVGNYTIFELAANQQKISDEALELLKGNISFIPVKITSLVVLNWDWSQEFDRQIEETMKQAQAVKRLEQELRAVEVSTQKQVKEAQAEKQAIELKAEAGLIKIQKEAEGKIAEGRGIAEYNRLVAQNMQLEIKLRELEIEKIKWEKFDGRLVPSYVPLTPNGAVVALPGQK